MFKTFDSRNLHSDHILTTKGKTNIQIEKRTRLALLEVGNMGQTYDSLIQELIQLKKEKENGKKSNDAE
jgi:hypothetical protein